MEELSTEEVERREIAASSSHSHPCDFLERAIRALLKCLGLDSSSSQASPKQEDTKKNPNTYRDSPSTTERRTKINEDVAGKSIITTRAFRRPTRPPVSSGGNPQINSTSS